jgi:uncharacterized protein
MDVRNNEAESRYELPLEGKLAIAGYRMQDGAVAFTHTEVPQALEGQGVGTRLIAGALADVRRRGLRIVPLCGFVRHYVETHLEAQDLLA